MKEKSHTGISRFDLTIFLLGVSLRLWHLGKQSLWMDEAFSVWVASHPFSEIFKILETDAHPPLFYSLLHFWLSRGTGEFYLRLPFAAVGALNSVLVYYLGKRCFTPRIALLSAFFWAVSFAALNAETQVRMYSMATCFSLLASIYFFNVLRNSSFLELGKYFVFAALALSTNYYTGFIVLIHLILFLKERKKREVFWISTGLFLLFVPWSYTFLSQLLIRFNPRPSIGLPEILTFSGFLGVYDFLDSRFLNVVLSVLGLLTVVLGISSIGSLKKTENAFLILAIVLGVFLPFLMSVFTTLRVYLFRYAIIVAPYFFLLFFQGLSRMPRILSVPFLTSLFIVNCFMWGLLLNGPGYERQNWRQAAQLLEARLMPGDDVVVEHFSSFFPLWYYLPDKFTLMYLAHQYAFGVISSEKTRVSWIPVYGKTPMSDLNQIVQSSQRQWLVLCQPTFEDPSDRVAKWFNQHGRNLFFVRFPSFYKDQEIQVFLYTKKQNKAFKG